MQSFSIIICTYNPDFTIFNRLLQAFLDFESSSPVHEIIFVDNNSQPGLESNPIVNNFLLKKKNSVLVKEKEPGLTAARIAGINQSKYDWIVFFDDDNEPCKDYLIEAAKVIFEYPKVGAWGPGTVKVDYTDKEAPKWLDKYKSIFQQRNDTFIKYDNNYWWQFCYPFGTGLIIKKVICEAYIAKVDNKQYLLSDRKGKSLSSGGDMQIVYTALAMNYHAGISPGIKLNHLISTSKSNTNYIARLLFGSAACNLPAYYQCFPDQFQVPVYPTSKVIFQKFYFLLKVVMLRQSFREAYFQLAKYLGELEGVVLLNPDIKKGKFLFLLERMLKIR